MYVSYPLKFFLACLNNGITQLDAWIARLRALFDQIRAAGGVAAQRLHRVDGAVYQAVHHPAVTRVEQVAAVYENRDCPL